MLKDNACDMQLSQSLRMCSAGQRRATLSYKTHVKGKNTKRSVSLVSLATVYSKKKKHGHAPFSVRVCSEWESCSLRAARLLCPLFSSEHTADCLPPPRAVEELPARQG